MRPSLIIVVPFIAIACGPDERPREPPTPPEMFDVVVGGSADPMSGGGGFVSVDSGADLPLRPGSQGGLHVFINLRLSTEALDAVSDQPIVYREGRRVRDGRLVSRIEHDTRFIASDESDFFDTEQSINMFLCPTPVDTDVADEMIELTVEIRPDYDEPVAVFGQLRFVPRCVADDEFCREVCYW